MGKRTAQLIQCIKEISTPTDVFYWGWFKVGDVRCHYRMEFCLETVRLTVWKDGQAVELEEDERKFLLRKLGEFSRVEFYPRPEPSSIGDEGSVAWACSVLCYMYIRREITAETREILGRPKFGYTFE